MDHHEVVDEAEILDRQPLCIDQPSVLGRHVHEAADAVGIDGAVVGIGQAKLAAAGHVAELIDGAGVGAGTAERGEVGDDGIGLVHHRLVAAKDLPRGVGRGEIDGVVEGIEAGEPVRRADRGLLPADLDRIRQEHVGPCQIDFHDGFALVREGRSSPPGNQASLTVSVLTSLPSASNTLATMPLASRPARPYIAAGVSWSWNTSGSTIERNLTMPLSSAP